MKQFFQGLAVVIGVIVVILAIAWIAEGNDFFMYQYFAPRQEAVRRKTIEQSKSYNDGMVQELQNMQFQYIKADSSQKDALASIILHRAANYDETKLPPDLYTFIQKLKQEQNSSPKNLNK